MVIEDAQGEVDKNRSQGDKAFEICDISDGRGGGAEGFVLRNPLADKAVDVDGDAIRGWIMPKIAEKLGFLMREAVGIRQKTMVNCQESLLVRIFG